ncbi:MAG: hypothetical protein ABRQ37_21545 [Candidatus Eremiobacterota bacterium]
MKEINQLSNIKCAFCGKRHEEVKRLLAGPVRGLGQDIKEVKMDFMIFKSNFEDFKEDATRYFSQSQEILNKLIVLNNGKE